MKDGLPKRRPDHPEVSLHCTCLVHISLSIKQATVLVIRYALLLLLTTFKLLYVQLTQATLSILLYIKLNSPRA